MTTTVDELQAHGCEPRIPRARAETMRRRRLGVSLATILAAAVWSQQVVWDIDGRYWPLLLMVTGMFIVAVGVLVGSPGCQWTAIGGTMLATAGGILQYQVITHRWTSWSYAWPLVAPLAVGVAVVLSALVHWAPESARAVGVRLIWAGVFGTAILFLFLEGVVGIGDLRIRHEWRLLLPLSLALAGVGMAVRAGQTGDGTPA